MNRSEQEKLRNATYMNKLKEANSLSELPRKLTKGDIVSVLQNTICFDSHLIREAFLDMADKLMEDKDYMSSPEFRENVKYLLNRYFSERTEIERAGKLEATVNSSRLANHLENIREYDKKYAELAKKESELKHEALMARIEKATTIGELPKGGISNITSEIAKVLYRPFRREQLKAEYTSVLAESFANGKTTNDQDVRDAIRRLVESKPMEEKYDSKSDDEKVSIVAKILEDDYEIPFLVEELVAKENRIKDIYKSEHDKIMEQIAASTRIRNLPAIPLSKITGYLSANSVVYPNGKAISSNDFRPLAEQLLVGKTFNDEEVQSELKKAINNNYETDHEEVYDLLKAKLSRLSRLDYFVDEVRFSSSRQKEFIAKGVSNVNVYLIPNPNADNGGLFYNLYISSKEEVLELEKIIPKDTPIELIEDLVNKEYDDTFKASGGIIVARDESIGNVNVFRPSGGPVGISHEEKEKNDKLEELSKKLSEMVSKANESKNKYAQELARIQEEYSKSQSEIDEQVRSIQEQISLMINPEDLGSKGNKKEL